MVSVCLPSDALSQHLLSYLGYLDEEIPYVQGVRPQISFFFNCFLKRKKKKWVPSSPENLGLLHLGFLLTLHIKITGPEVVFV